MALRKDNIKTDSRFLYIYYEKMLEVYFCWNIIILFVIYTTRGYGEMSSDDEEKLHGLHSLHGLQKSRVCYSVNWFY